MAHQTGTIRLERVDHVGSLLRPRPLLEAFQSWEAGQLDTAILRSIQDRFVGDAVKLQEDVGLSYVTDGEFRRRSWQRGFIDAVGGFATKPGPIAFVNNQGVSNPAPVLFAERRLQRSRGIVTDDFDNLRRLTARTPKVTLPSPTIFHYGLFSRCVEPDVYADIEEYFEDLIAIYHKEFAELRQLGCTYVQLDEVPLATLCDRRVQDIARAQGEDPAKLIELYIRLNKRVLAGRPEGMMFCMHLCRGNQAGLWIAEGGLDPIAERLFNELDLDGFLLEYDSPRAGDFRPLRYVPKGKRVFIGLVSTKDPSIEAEDSLMLRVEEAARVLPSDQLGICPQCGFASSISKWNITANPMTEDIQRRKLERLVHVSERLWG